MNTAKWTSALIVSLILSALAANPIASAFSIRYDSSVRASLNKLPQPSKPIALYTDAIGLQQQLDGIDGRIAKLHAENEQALLGVRQRIKLIDAGKLSRLDAQAKQAKQRYQPLFDDYRAANQQLTAAKYIPGKEIKAVLRLKADLMKPAVQLARQDIRAKEAALKEAKEATAKTVKKIKDVLGGISSSKAKIQAEKAAAAIPAKHLSSAWSAAGKSLKKADSKGVTEALSDLNSLFKQTIARKQAIQALEVQIGGIIAKANSLIPA
ncbi:hypothetical protein ACFPVX_23645 [Cohnella faecalis]|uniref:SbsC C-terminal domain-containing protein n=1 Tax=Cohnella faecalis TaxID=2315694 RepID=A0A398CHC3_9BACL|nr:hypothetical protein [Cohnella faecalis]RIE02153.1 hypothetical protein D3H35_15505 [Cohnella faecalis]